MKKIKQNVATYWVAYALYRPSMWTFIKRRRMEIHARHWVGYIEGVHELYKLEQDLAAWYDKGCN